MKTGENWSFIKRLCCQTNSVSGWPVWWSSGSSMQLSSSMSPWHCATPDCTIPRRSSGFNDATRLLDVERPTRYALLHRGMQRLANESEYDPRAVAAGDGAGSVFGIRRWNKDRNDASCRDVNAEVGGNCLRVGSSGGIGRL